MNERGWAGFVMASSAPDARSSEMELRRQLIQAQAVDVVVAVGTNMFYTVTLPCTLWFLDRGRGDTERAENVLFLDARHIFRQVDRAHRDWSEAQIGFLANVVRLYRGEDLDLGVGGNEAHARLKDAFGAKPKYSDVAGFCRVTSIADIATRGWSLNPGHYVETVVPPADVVAAFCRIADAFADGAATLQLQVANQRQTRHLLLPRLLSGQLRLADIENDPRLSTAPLEGNEQDIQA